MTKLKFFLTSFVVPTIIIGLCISIPFIMGLACGSSKPVDPDLRLIQDKRDAETVYQRRLVEAQKLYQEETRK